MSKKEKEQTISINDKEYKVADLTKEQVVLVNHATDLNRKLESANFNVQQLQIGYDAVMKMLTESLDES